VFGGRRAELLGLFARQLDDGAVAGRVRGDTGVVEDHRERGHRLSDRLSGLAALGQVGDEGGDVLRGDLGDGTAAEHGQSPLERGAMHDAGGLGDVEA